MSALKLVALYAWSSPYGVVGLLAAVLFRALGWVEHWRWRDGALEVVCRGPFASWMARPRADGFSWAGVSLGFARLFWRAPDEEVRAHELGHFPDVLRLGVLFLPAYLLLLTLFGYENHPLEVAARSRAARRLQAEPDTQGTS